jgi:hypothetical protein
MDVNICRDGQLLRDVLFIENFTEIVLLVSALRTFKSGAPQGMTQDMLDVTPEKK